MRWKFGGNVVSLDGLDQRVEGASALAGWVVPVEGHQMQLRNRGQCHQSQQSDTPLAQDLLRWFRSPDSVSPWQ